MYDIIVFAHLYKPHLGGLEKYVEFFYKNLHLKRVLIITSHYDRTLKIKDKDEHLDILRISSIEILKGKYFIPNIKGLKQIHNVFKKKTNKTTVIHTHTRFYLLNFIATVVSKRYSLKHYHIEHGSTFVKDGSGIVRLFAYLFDKTFARYILKNSELVFSVSKKVQDFLNTHYTGLKHGPLLYNSCSFNTEDFKLKPKPTTLKLLFVGRLVKSKGIYELLESAKILSKTDINFTLTIIGSGSEEENVKKYIAENSLQNIILLKGSLPYEQTQKEYRKNDLFINPSYTEGLPTTVLEALSNGLVIIATDVGGTGEIIPQKHLINDQKISAQEIKRNIELIYNNWDDFQKEYSGIYSRARKVFSWKSNTSKYIKAHK